jgi:hypothetical protein
MVNDLCYQFQEVEWWGIPRIQRDLVGLWKQFQEAVSSEPLWDEISWCYRTRASLLYTLQAYIDQTHISSFNVDRRSLWFSRSPADWKSSINCFLVVDLWWKPLREVQTRKRQAQLRSRLGKRVSEALDILSFLLRYPNDNSFLLHKYELERDRQTERQTYIQTDRQTDRQTVTYR